MIIKRCVAFIAALCITVGTAAFAQSDYATRGEVADFLLEAADFYNPDVLRSDIIKGYEDGSLHEDWSVTRAEALVMLKRAFGSLPEPVGHNKRTALTSDDFTDIPVWAESELADVFDSGIAAGTAAGIFSPDDNVTKAQMELFVKRVYSLYGENVRDDFYATVNKKILEDMKIPQGEFIQGTVYNMQTNASTQVDSIVKQIASGNHKKGTPKQKMADLYRCVMDVNAIDKNSVTPIKKYLDRIDSVKNIGELSLLQTELAQELCVSPFVEFSLVVDFEQSSQYMLCFNTLEPLMNKDLYFDDGSTQQQAYIAYLETLLMVGGEDEAAAKANAGKYFEFEKVLAANMLSVQEQNSVEKIYNILTYSKLEAMFPDFNLDEVLEAGFLEKEERALVFDTALAQKFSGMYNQANIEVLKTAAKIAVLNTWGATLDTRIDSAYQTLENEIFGTDGTYTREQKATLVLQNTMPEYLGEIYVGKYFDEKSKKDVMNMVLDIREVFKERINSLTWMSERTKEKAVRKLDSMDIKIGYPDSFDTFMDEVVIVAPEDGGTYFSNMLAITKGAARYYASLQKLQIDYSAWPIYPYTANAGYDLTGNSITFPAAILQVPLYDKDASYEENLGGIGYIIAHEMTHAFDNNGALFDEHGNMSNWWTEADYKEFEKLCDEVVEFYNGYEAIAAVPTNGTLTLSENVSDMGAAACIVQLAQKKKDADYQKLFYAMANTFANTATREYAKYAMQYDPHADGKARINCVVVHLDEFYTAFGVAEGDGMYIPPEERIVIW